MYATYACLPDQSKGRLFFESTTPHRNEYARDRDRIIHANAFRRLQYKTQVFANLEADHYRNRLTHSIEVSSLARSLAKTLRLHEDLAESVGLAHDLGHTPFGHAGEDALNECMQEYGGFSHNAHSLKILTSLEHRYAAFDGLNLTWEVLEGIVKHNGPLTGSNIPAYILQFNNIYNLDLEHYSSAEAQIASLADDIAYICHDIEDSVRAQIISINDLTQITLINQYITEVTNSYKDITTPRLIYEVVRKLTHHLIDSLLRQTSTNFKQQKINTSNDIRLANFQLVDFTEETIIEIKNIKEFLYNKVYRHHQVTSVTLRCQKIIKKLFKLYMDNIDLLPFNWRELIDLTNSKQKASVISDYIAGMTDRFAIKEYESFYNLNFSKI